MSSPRTVNQGVDPFLPVHAVWELTMRCDHACSHCGSRAAQARPDELSTAELLEVADALADLGCREVALIGGEAYLHPGMLDVTRRLHARNVRVIVQTGGRGVTAALALEMKQAGVEQLGVSVDGPPAEHDTLRASPGSHRAAMRALANGRDAGMITTVNTQVNRLSLPKLRETCDILRPAGIRAWRAQLTAPMGRAADRPDWLLEPYQILEAIDTLAALKLELAAETRAAGRPISRMMDIQLGNNLGYYGPHEQTLRSSPGGTANSYAGCVAGKYVLGIESDGTVKGCPSLPTAPYVGGNVRELRLAELWEQSPELRFTRDRDTSELWGFCAGCMYAERCMGGCSFTAHTTLGRRGNNPFCYHRAATLRRQGRRERLVLAEAAPGRPYDFGRFEIVEEDWDVR